MKIRYAIFVAFILALYIIFQRVSFIDPTNPDRSRPDFKLVNSYIEHYVEGDMTFKIWARQIDIYAKKKFYFHKATVEFGEKLRITADLVEADFNKFVFNAEKNVQATSGKFNYYGDRIKYLVKEKKFFSYNVGKIKVER